MILPEKCQGVVAFHDAHDWITGVLQRLDRQAFKVLSAGRELMERTPTSGGQGQVTPATRQCRRRRTPQDAPMLYHDASPRPFDPPNEATLQPGWKTSLLFKPAPSRVAAPLNPATVPSPAGAAGRQRIYLLFPRLLLHYRRRRRVAASNTNPWRKRAFLGRRLMVGRTGQR